MAEGTSDVPRGSDDMNEYRHPTTHLMTPGSINRSVVCRHVTDVLNRHSRGLGLDPAFGIPGTLLQDPWHCPGGP